MTEAEHTKLLRWKSLNALWGEKELCNLCMGLPPDAVHATTEESNAIAQAISRAITAGHLETAAPVNPGAPGSMYAGVTYIKPASAIRWASPIFPEFPFPPPSADVGDHSEAQGKPVSTRERNNLLRTLAAACHLANVDFRQPSKAALQLVNASANVGATLAARTVEEQLKQIQSALDAANR